MAYYLMLYFIIGYINVNDVKKIFCIIILLNIFIILVTMKVCNKVEPRNGLLTTCKYTLMSNKSFLIFVLLVSILTLVVVADIFASVPIVFQSTDKFPKVEVKFMLVDNTNNVVTNLTRQQAGVTFYDNGIPLSITSFVSATNPTERASVLIAFDLSISQRTSNPSEFTFATDMTNRYISYLSDGQTDVSLVSISNIPSVEIDFTTTTNSVAVALNNFSPKNYGNLYRGIASSNTGALSVLGDANTKIKTILLVTQGIISFDESELIIARAKQNGVKINILYVSNVVPENIKRIADGTGGYCVNREVIEKFNLSILAAMAKLSEGYTPYSFMADASINCDSEHTFKLVADNVYGSNEFFVEIDDVRFTRIEASPNSLEFSYIKPTTTMKQNTTIYARNSDLKIDAIYLDNPYFSITNGTPTFPHYLNKDAGLELEITFTPVDSCISFARLIIESDACSYDTLFITGGYPNIPPRFPSIKIVNPKCNEVLVIGDTVEIEWNGVLPKDVVSIFSERDKKGRDTIAKNVTGLRQRYIVEDNGEEDSIRFIINQMWPNNIGKTLNFKHNATVLSAFWNNYQDRIITRTALENTVTIWNANTGDKINTFPRFGATVNWAVYAPNPNSINDNYIGIACQDSCVYFFNATDFSLYWRYKSPHSLVWSVEFSADCKYAIIGLGDGNFEILDIAKQEMILRKHIGFEDCRFATFHPTEQYEIMTVSSYSGIIKFFDLAGNLKDTISAKKGRNLQNINTHYVTYNQDGSKILLINYQVRGSDFIDRSTGNVVYTLNHNSDDETNSVAFASFFHKTEGVSGNEDCIVTSGKDGVLRRWNTDGSPTLEDAIFIEHTGTVNTGVLNKDGWRLLSASDDSTAKIWNLNQKTLQSYTTCKFRIGYAKGQVTDTLDLGNVFQGEIILKTFDDAFINMSDFNYNIRSIKIVGDHPTDFGIIDIDDSKFPMKINAIGHIHFNIEFKPTAVGDRKARIQIIIPNDTLYIELIGVGLNIGLRPLCEFIDFKNVYTDDYKDSLLPVAVNISDTTINIENIDLTGSQKLNYKFTIGNETNSLKPNDTLFADIRFFPLTIGKKNAILNIKHSYHSYPLSFNLTGKGVPINVDTVLLNINDIAAETGQTIGCPIILNTLSHNNIADINEIIFSLVFNATVVYPQTKSNEVKILNSQLLDNGNGIVDIAIPYKPGQQLIDGLQFVALFGNDTMTTIQIINSKAYNNVRYFIKGNIATLTLINNCNAGGTRLFDENGRLLLHQNAPNPVINETKIEFELIENGLTSLDIYDITGKHIMNIFNEEKQKGSYEIIIDTKDMNRGMYYYILHNARQQLIRNMIVK